jgi:COMPASS component SWD2
MQDPSKMVRLNPRLIECMSMAKVFKDNTGRINALDFYKDGELLITSSDDESMNLYNCTEGKKKKVVYSKKYGVDLVRFTHHQNAVICASKNEWDESLRYLSLHDNKYLRYFKGHRDKVVSLAMSPRDDMFISGSLDNTVRLWDLNSNSCQGVLRRRGRPCVSFDPQGLIFSVATATNVIKLYDLRSYDGTFLLFHTQHQPRGVVWSQV